MSEIYFIRHGQASFGTDDYDRLSSVGVRQSKILARHLARTGQIFDAVYCGKMERQQKTAEALLNHYREIGLAVPQPQIDENFNEYDSLSVWDALIPEMTAERPSLAGEVEKLPGDPKAFQKIFSEVMNRWTQGDYKASAIPRWDEFTRRVVMGLESMTARHGAKKRLAVFTSGGPISVAVRSALGLSDRMTLEISWQLMNASITRIKYSSRGIMLAGFNDVSHLELEGDVRLLTYR